MGREIGDVNESRRGSLRLFPPRISHGQLVVSTRQLATLVKAGMPLLRALRTVSDQLEPGALRQVFASVAGDVEGGIRLSEALSRYPHCFPSFYVNMIRAGEVGGMLDEILKRL
ncbi:MAG: type II secretion system F family protein, partial [Candidatus Omnitrophica bacterium]|nr:type II secretion system F family protein [Candidatus Omnitrophota bacterium]